MTTDSSISEWDKALTTDWEGILYPIAKWEMKVQKSEYPAFTSGKPALPPPPSTPRCISERLLGMGEVWNLHTGWLPRVPWLGRGCYRDVEKESGDIGKRRARLSVMWRKSQLPEIMKIKQWMWWLCMSVSFLLFSQNLLKYVLLSSINGWKDETAKLTSRFFLHTSASWT